MTFVRKICTFNVDEIDTWKGENERKPAKTVKMVSSENISRLTKPEIQFNIALFTSQLTARNRFKNNCNVCRSEENS